VEPGDYTFMVRAFDAEGMKGERSLVIHVNPPWWRTWWAYGVYALVLGFSIFALYREQKRRIIGRERQRTQEIELAQAREIEKAYHELRSTQAQLIHAEKMASLGELTSGIAHEIQNPLNFVMNFSDVNKELLVEMKDDIGNGNIEDVRQLVEHIMVNTDKVIHHSQRADAIVKSMLKHSRVGSGQKEPTDINALVDEYLKLSYHGMIAKDSMFRCSLQTDYDLSLSKINVIPQDIGRVLLNLFNNAFYAVTEKREPRDGGYEPMIQVSTKKSGNQVEIKVRDNGMGIPQKIKSKIFQPFFTTKPTGQGTGLGLSLSYDIAKVHGGEITVETVEGEFTEFTVQLPG
jgi:signal transduction histidine kinase